MNICYIAPAYHPIIGGAETYIKTLAEGMAHNHNVTVITDNQNRTNSFEVINGVKVYRLSNYLNLIEDPTKIRWEQLYFSLLHEFEKIFIENNFHLIHANSLETTIMAAMLGKQFNLPIVSTIHEQYPEKEPGGPGKCTIVYDSLNINKFVAGSEFYYKKATQFTSSSKVRLIYHGVSSEKFKPTPLIEMRKLKERFSIDADTELIVCAARLKERKGILELIKAYKLVKPMMQNIALIVAGSCNSASRAYADSLYNEIDDSELQVRIIEDLTHEDISDLFKAADIVAQPSHAEGLGLSVIEALATEKPVISTNIQGINEILTHNDTGYLIPPKDINALKEALIHMLQNKSYREGLARRGYDHYKKNFSIENQLKETYLLYEEISN